MSFLGVFIRDLKRIHSICFLCVSSGFEIIRGFIMTTGIALGVYWMTNGSMNRNYDELKKGIIVFSFSILFSVFALFLINFGKQKHYNKLKKKLQGYMVVNILANEHRKNNINDADVIYRFDRCLDDYVTMLNSTVFFIGSFGKVFGGVISGFSLSWVLTLLLILFGLFKLLIDKHVAEPLREHSKLLNDAYAKQYSSVIQLIDHVVFNRFMYDKYKLQKLHDGSLDQAIKSKEQLEKINNRIAVIGLLTEKVAFILLLIIGAVLAFLTQSVDIGTFASFVSLFDMFVNPYQFISSFNVDLCRYQKSIYQVIELTGENCSPEPIKEETYSAPFRLVFEQVDFGYTPGKLVLKNINLCFFSGRINYILGASGIGKTTLIKMIAGLLHQNRGSIYIFEESSAKKFSINTSEVSYVSQIAFLFNDSIAANIALSETIDYDRLDDACKKAGLFDFIMSLNEKYQYEIIDDGSNISTGQRCRLALARAFYHPAKIILIDEVFANIDGITITEIYQNIKLLADEGKCVIFVTHRTEWIEEDATIINLQEQ